MLVIKKSQALWHHVEKMTAHNITEKRMRPAFLYKSMHTLINSQACYSCEQKDIVLRLNASPCHVAGSSMTAIVLNIVSMELKSIPGHMREDKEKANLKGVFCSMLA